MDLFKNPGLEINQKDIYAPHQDEIYAIHYQTYDLRNTKLVVYVLPNGKLDFVFEKINHY
ncbi:hypothetical protein ACNAN0_05550 [Agrilactobacillus fermenti]|uniref:hypothetical protein n=1 Tax=Agrilactobacillus fermenti TaxID=2586909 RepID=UPI003A5BBBF7